MPAASPDKLVMYFLNNIKKQKQSLKNYIFILKHKKVLAYHKKNKLFTEEHLHPWKQKLCDPEGIETLTTQYKNWQKLKTTNQQIK